MAQEWRTKVWRSLSIDVPLIVCGVKASALWRMNEGAGLIVDNEEGTAEADMTLDHADIWNAGGQFGSCLLIDGGVSGHYGLVSDGANVNVSGEQKCTWVFWVKVLGLGENDEGSFWYKDDAYRIFCRAGGDIQIILNDGVNFDFTNYYRTTGHPWASPPMSAYQVVAIVYDGTLANDERLKIFLDGYELAGTTTGTIPAAITDTEEDLYVGDSPANDRAANAHFDTFAIFKGKAFTPKEIEDLYYKSLFFDLGQARDVQSVIATGLNLTSNAEVKLLSSTDDVTYTDRGDLTLDVSDVRGNAFRLALLDMASAISARYWQLRILDIANPDNFTEVGRVHLGTYYEPAKGWRMGWTQGWGDLTSVLSSDYGVKSTNIKARLRTFNGATPPDDSYYNDFYQHVAATGRKSFFINFDPSKHIAPAPKAPTSLTTFTVYGWWTELPGFQSAFKNKGIVSFTFQEAA